MTTKTDYGEVYLVNSRSEILNIPTNFCLDFLNDLKNEVHKKVGTDLICEVELIT